MQKGEIYIERVTKQPKQSYNTIIAKFEIVRLIRNWYVMLISKILFVEYLKKDDVLCLKQYSVNTILYVNYTSNMTINID